MVEQLRNEFPEITSYPSFLIGDSILDFKLGQDVGAYCYGMRHIHNRDQDWSSFSIHEVSDFESFTTQLQHVLRKPVS